MISQIHLCSFKHASPFFSHYLAFILQGEKISQNIASHLFLNYIMALSLVAKAGLELNIKKTKITTTEEIHNSNLDNEDKEIVKDFVYRGSTTNLSGDCGHDIKIKLRRIRIDHPEQRCVIAKITHIVPTTPCGWGSWPTKTADGGKNH